MTSSPTSRLLRTTALAGGLLALAAAPAVAKHRPHHSLAPPGNSGINQYVESYPTASGSQPTNSVHSSHNGSGPSAGGGTGGGGGGAGGVSNATAGALAAQGPAGAAAASLARATAPPRARSHSAQGVYGTPAADVGGSPSSTSSILSALTGSSSGGLGVLLPALLIVALVGAAGLALIRHRRVN